jgi:hypothetical protein
MMNERKPNPRNSKPISLHPLRPEDVIKAALMTPPPPKKKARRKKIESSQ